MERLPAAGISTGCQAHSVLSAMHILSVLQNPTTCLLVLLPEEGPDSKSGREPAAPQTGFWQCAAGREQGIFDRALSIVISLY